ncbi:MAG: recombination protein RecR [Magnetococcales bacterium]|nr:recombination protein RecR [Magnetococcales bacterium]
MDETRSGLPSVARAILLFSRFPGVGRKSAQRMVQHLLRRGRTEIDMLVDALGELRDKVRPCARCFNLAEEELCWICADPRRDPTTLCVLEETSDLLAMEKAGSFQGVYHVLGGRLSPLDGIGPEQLHIAPLCTRLRAGNVAELIIATNPTVEGEATAHYIVQISQPLVGRITRLACGLPMGGELEYMDESTLHQALAGRRAF